MSKILLMTVGTGVGPVDSKSKNLARGLELLISHIEPDFTVLDQKHMKKQFIILKKNIQQLILHIKIKKLN